MQPSSRLSQRLPGQRFLAWLCLLGLLVHLPLRVRGETFSELFNYTSGTALVGQGGWTIIGSTTTNPLTVSNGAVTLATSGQDAGVALGFSLTAAAGNTFYAGFDLTVSAAGTGDYFLAFSSSATSTSYNGKVYVKSSGTGYVLGMTTGTSTAATYSSTVLAYGTSYRVVVRYNMISGTGNDTAMFYIDPTSATESANPGAVATNIASAASSEAATIAAVALRQGTNGSAATVSALDNLIISTTFADAADLGGAGVTAPAVTATTPADGATTVDLASAIAVTFNQAVTLADGWFTLSGSTTGAIEATVSGSGTTVTLTPSTIFAESETITLTISAAKVTATTGGTAMAADATVRFTTALDPTTLRPIHLLQGSGTASTLTGNTVTAQGIVTGFYSAASGSRDGFYLQEEDADADADATTSEGIYVYMGDNTASLASAVAGLAIGDKVTVKGVVKEFSNLTELATVSALTVNASGQTLPTATSIILPLSSGTFLERYEGMRVTLPQTLTVTDVSALGQYGQFALSYGGLRAQPTNVVAPGAAATALQTANDLNLITIDDGTAKTYLDPTAYLYGSGTEKTLRAGDTTTGVTGVVTYIASTYMVEPTTTPTFANSHPRTAPEVSNGSLRVVGANVLNYFNGDGAGSGFPTSRGATTLVEFQRQRDHVLAALLALKPDIIGLTEIENDGFASTSAIADLVAGLNAGAPSGTTYAFVNPLGGSTIGTDAITCAFVYNTATVSLVGSAAVNTDATFNRPPIAQTFRQVTTGEKLTVTVNHFKSKGSSGSSGANADQNDGQSAWNLLRTQQATLLTTWLATNPTGVGDADVLIIGDLNSYAKEDPISTIVTAGYENLIEALEGVGGYSYAFNGMFGHLDHALATPSLADQATAAGTWHNNSVEPEFLDYNVENKATTGANYAINVGATPWRASDHDPVYVDFLLATPITISTQPAAQTIASGDTLTLSVAATGTGTLAYQWFKDDAVIPGAIGATYTVTGATAAATGRYKVVVTDYYGPLTSDSVAVVVTQTYAQWASSAGLTTANNGTAADPDGDGVANALEYVLGTNPTNALAAGEPSATTASGQFLFRYTTSRLANAVPVVQSTTDLTTWTTLTPTLEASTDTTQSWVASVSVDGSQAFLRLAYGDAATVPVGFIQTTLASGATSVWAPALDPLTRPAVGLRAGRVEGVTASTVSHYTAGWAAGALAVPATPWAIRFTSGAAAGKTLPITGNTTNTVTISGASLSAIGVAVGDAFELVATKTLGSHLTGIGLTGSTSAASADVVQVRSGTAWVSYYYNTTAAAWRRTIGSTASANTVTISAESGLLITRRGATLPLLTIGRVLGTTFRPPVFNAGTTVLTTGYPKASSLGDLAVQTRLTGWRSGTTTAAADQVLLYNGSGWTTYLYNGSSWQTTTGSNANAVPLPAGSLFTIQRPGTTSGTTDLILNLAY